VAVVLTLVTNKNKYTYINETIQKLSKQKYTHYQNTHTIVKTHTYTHPHITKQDKTTTVQDKQQIKYSQYNQVPSL